MRTLPLTKDSVILSAAQRSRKPALSLPKGTCGSFSRLVSGHDFSPDVPKKAKIKTGL